VNSGQTALQYLSFGTSKQVLRTNSGATSIEFASPIFTDLTDCPSTYTSSANKVVVVNSGATGLTFDGTKLGDCVYKLTGAQNINSTPATILYGTAVYDSLNVGSFASNTYTAGASGARVLVSATIYATFNNSEIFTLYVEKNSTTQLGECELPNQFTSGAANYTLTVTVAATLAAGDTIRVRASSNTATNRALSTNQERTYLSIVELG
jgi:hypothetical protein